MAKVIYIIKRLYVVIVTLTDALSIYTCCQLKKNRLVGIVKLDAIGDSLLWLDSAQMYRAIYPKNDFTLVLICNSSWFEVAEKLSCFDEVLSVDRRQLFRNLLYRWEILRKVRRAGYSQVVNVTYSRDFLYGDSIVRATGASVRIGSQGDLSNRTLWQKRIGDSWYTRLLPAIETPLMELARNAEFIRELGVLDFRAGLPLLQFTSTAPSCFSAQNYYVLVPGAGSAMRRWPLERFAQVAREIHTATGWTAVICGGKDEVRLGASLLAQLDVPAENWVGKTSLLELIAVIDGSNLVVCNETSAVHIAAVVDTPAICILGGGHFGRFLPYVLEMASERPLPLPVYWKMPCYNCNWNCIYHLGAGEPAPCITNIEATAVWSEIRKFLQ